MKNLIRTAAAFAGLLLLPLLTVAQTTRSLQSFDEIVITGRIEIELIAGDSSQLVILESPINEDKINIGVSRNILRINTLSQIAKDEVVKLQLTYVKLRSIRAQAGAVISHRTELTGDKLELRLGSGARADIALAVEVLSSYAGEGAELRIKGSAQTQEAMASSGGVYDATDLSTVRTYIRANTGGKAYVTATELLDITVNTGGEVYYKGQPKEKYINSMLGGSIHQI